MNSHDSGFISAKDLAILEEMHLASPDKKIADRIKAIILLDKGWTYDQIAEALLLTNRTIHRYRKLYEKEGVDGFWEHEYKGGFSKLSDDDLQILKKELTDYIYSDSKEVVGFIYRRFGVKYTANGLVPLLRRIGFSYKKTKAIPAKVDPEKQADFVKAYDKRFDSLKKDEKMFFIDAVHPTYNMMPEYAWLPKGVETYIQSNSGRQRLNIYGAYSPNDKSRIIRTYETINQESVISLLKEIERRNPDYRIIYVFLDNARYNYSKAVRDFIKGSKISPIYLPSYSPNLNLIERLWRLMKRSVIGNTYYETFEDFRKACLYFLKRKDRQFMQQLDTLMSRKFQSFPEIQT